MRAAFEPRFGHDFSQVRVHADGRAAEAARAAESRAFTIGRDIVFGAGEYRPATAEGRRLLAHELAHVVQQRGGWASTDDPALEREAESMATHGGRRCHEGSGVPRAVMQRSAIASWSEANDSERLYFLSESKRKTYARQQAKLAKGKTVKKPVTLPQVDKILNITANYHHHDKYPTPEGGVLLFDTAIVNDVKKQFRIGANPDFWPNIKWKGKDGQFHDIGVRFHISFTPHAMEPAAGDRQNYAGESMMNDPAVRSRPEENIALLRQIDEAGKAGVDMRAIIKAADHAGIHNFVYDRENRIVTYTPSSGPSVRYNVPDDTLTIVKLVREEAKAQNLEQALQNNVLGYASDSSITFDPAKAAPPSITFPEYEPIDNVNYEKYEREAMKKLKTVTFTPETQRQRLVAVVVHEIGHNIGMGHTDFGVMKESTEIRTFVKRKIEGVYDPGKTTSGVTVSNVPRMIEVSLETQTETLTQENVQRLVDRLRDMTDYVLPLLPADPTAQKPTLQGFWATPIAELKPLLTASNDSAIFADEQYVAMLAIPYQKATLDDLVSGRKMISGDRSVILDALSATGHLDYAAWQKLSSSAQAYIRNETLRMIDKSFSGMTFFSSQQEREAY